MAEPIRIQKAIANAGLMSRRSAEDAIAEGRVEKNGARVVLGDRVDVEGDQLTIDGIPIPVNPALETHLVYKPVGVISTAHDTHGRPTVLDLIDSQARLYPVGRLDADSEGLILVTNDGELTNRVTHPRYGITKTYVLEVDGQVSADTLRQLTRGVMLDDGLANAKKARMVEQGAKRSLLELTMGEGRNREVRRMMSAVGHEVTSLVRTAIGPLKDPDLPPGTSRRVTPSEIRLLLGSGIHE